MNNKQVPEMRELNEAEIFDVNGGLYYGFSSTYGEVVGFFQAVTKGFEQGKSDGKALFN